MSKPTNKPKPTAKVRGKPSELKVLEAIYSVTDCSNGVYEYAKLHWTQARIADGMIGLVSTHDGVVSVDGDGRIEMPERYGTGYKLTHAGYRALTRSDPERFPTPTARSRK